MRDPLLEEIKLCKQELPITELLSFFTGRTFRVRSGWQSCHCPFHGDKVESAAINVTLGRFKCHACDVSGDVIDLAKIYLGTTKLREALDWLKTTFLTGR